MAAASAPERIALAEGDVRWSTGELGDLSAGGATVVAQSGAEYVVYVGTGGLNLPLLIFSAARAARPFCPINYRLSPENIRALIQRVPRPLIVADRRYWSGLVGTGVDLIESGEFVHAARRAHRGDAEMPDPDSPAVVLFTSGTTAQPKAVELSHHNLSSYILSTVDFQSAEPDEASLVCVPPYHVAGVGAALSNLYSGRKIVYLADFDAREWIRLVTREQITTATVVPTMLDRIVAELERVPVELNSLRNLAYGGSKVPLPLVRRAMELLPDGVGLVNAYGLTETSSTIAVLTPEDHRAARDAIDDAVGARLASVGRPVPGIEVQIRDDAGRPVSPGTPGELFVRGEQVSGRYTGIGSVLDDNGWFATKDLASVDEAGYLFIKGRSDDTIIRGGENIAPSEIEDVLVEHPDVREVAVVGADDPRWGQVIVAVVVPKVGSQIESDALRDFVRERLRGSRTPDRVVFVDELPTNATGKVLRRELLNERTPQLNRPQRK
jgi:acyl-CoA synthetase (AMP-forming)/AMP-acid ligase II